MKKINRVYTPQTVEKLRSRGFYYTATNHQGESVQVVVDEDLVSSEGMSFTMIDEGQPQVVFKQVEKEIKRNRDVVGAILLARTTDTPPF